MSLHIDVFIENELIYSNSHVCPRVTGSYLAHISNNSNFVRNMLISSLQQLYETGYYFYSCFIVGETELI